MFAGILGAGAATNQDGSVTLLSTDGGGGGSPLPHIFKEFTIMAVLRSQNYLFSAPARAPASLFPLYLLRLQLQSCFAT